MVPDGSVSRSSEKRQSWQSAEGLSGLAPAVPDASYSVESDEKTVISKRPLTPQVPHPFPTKPSEVGLSLVGGTLGHFQLQEFVGGGGMGAVFRAIDTTLGRTVAVKVVSNQNADEDMLRRFRNEAQSAARLDHPNIARVYYVGEERGWSYIVFEFIEGVNIRDLVQQRSPLEIAEVVSYTLQIAEALEHAAERDVVHRDIKPSNILVMPDGRAKLVDMGLARLHQVDAPSQDLTETGVTLGTFDYISPEQARDPRSADTRSDLYSLGCTLYFMLTGAPPFPEGTVLQKLLSHSSDPPPDPRELRPDIDEELCGVALRLMAKLPTQRFQSPGELIDRLLVLSDRMGLPHERRIAAVTLPPMTWWQSLLRTHLPWIVPALLLVTTVFGLETFSPGSPAISRDALQPFPESSGQSSSKAREESVTTETVAPPSRPVQELQQTAAARLSPAARNEQNESIEPARSAVETRNGKVETSSQETARLIPESSANSKSAFSVTPIESFKPNPNPDTESVVPPVTSTASGERPSDSSTTESDPKPSGTRENPPVGEVEPVELTTLVVWPEAGPASKPSVVGSLDAAFQKLLTAPQVDTIELRFRERVESPLTLAPRSQESELTIRAGAEHSPLIIFRPTSGGFHDRNCWKLIGGRVNFVGVHFLVELTGEYADDWSLFHLKDMGRVTFTNCSLTIRNERGVTATFFSVDGPALAKMMMPTETPEVSTGPIIELKSCVVRGDANLVRAQNGLPFTLNWTQGFLATSKTAIVARGLHDNDGAMLIRLKFSQLTSSLGGGLCRVDIDATAPVVPDLRIETNNCVWLQWDPETPLVEHRGIENIDQLTQNLYRYAGEQNLYPATRILWRVQSRSGEIVNHRWRDASPGMWYTEGSVDKGVRWRRALPSEGRATFTYSFRDFLLEPELAKMAGFNESFLPEPREPDPPAPAAAKPPVVAPATDTPL